ncbi:glycosyltransferase [Candidatus Wolfebacteria bacterium]|nr:glycosyltransferase [Candidatus Wolfebacteria bacterium]
MKILHIVPSYIPAHRYGGPIESVHELNKGLVKNGVEVVVYTTNIDGSKVLNVPFDQAVDIDGVKVFYFPITFRPWQYSYKLHCALEKNIQDFDLVHITSIFLSISTLGAYYARKFNKPYIISPRGSLMFEPMKKNEWKKKIYISLIEKRNLAGAEAVHFTVEKEKNDYLNLKLSLEKAIIVSNSIDVRGFNIIARDNIEFRKKFKIAADKKVILFMGRLHKIKGLDTLIPAFARVLEKEQNAVLVLAGPDENNYKKEIDKMIIDYELQDGKNVIFTGMLVGDDKISAYRESEVFVLPSYSESFGMSVIEAMIMRLPVVVTKGVGVGIFINKSRAGIVVDKNEDDLSEAIVLILKNKNLGKEMGERGKKMIEEEFSQEMVAKKFLKEYSVLIKKH